MDDYLSHGLYAMWHVILIVEQLTTHGLKKKKAKTLTAHEGCMLKIAIMFNLFKFGKSGCWYANLGVMGVTV